MRLTTLTRLLGGSVVLTFLAVTGAGGAGAQAGTTASTDTTVAPTTTAAPATTEAPSTTEAPATTAPSRDPAQVASMLQTAKQSCDGAISGRLDTTSRLRNRAGDQTLSDGDRNAILSILDRTDAGLNDLKPQIDNATDGATLRAPCKSIAADYRVYMLVVPQVRLTLASAGEGAAADKLLNLADKLQNAAQSHTAKRKASVDIDSLLQDMRDKANAAKSKIGGVPSTALAVTVDQVNAGVGKPTLSQDRNDVDAVQQLLHAADKDAQQVLKALGR